MNRVVRPMLATLTKEPFDSPEWVYEEKYDGYRILAYKRGKDVLLVTRNLKDYTDAYPAVAAAIRALPTKEFVLDGEVVIFDTQGNSNFQMLQQEELRGKRRPAYVAFDCLEKDGADVTGLPWTERRRVMESIVPAGKGTVRRSRILPGDGMGAYAAAKQKGWEGVIAKRKASAYVPDSRSPNWLKVKARHEEEFVIGGYTPPGGGRKHFGALLVGLFDGRQLRYAGKVGTGYTEGTLRDLLARMRPLAIDTPPFSNPPRERGAVWVKPVLVAQIAYAEWTRDGRLRQPAFLGLREDKAARSVTWNDRES